MVKVFISYRRDDSAGYAGRLADSLDTLLGKDNVFRDVEDIKPGEDFVNAIERNLQNATVLLVIIGKDWLKAKDNQGLRRLDSPIDYVRIEIEIALRLDLLIIPILVDGAVMPKSEQMPKSIAAIANRQAIEITDNRWEQDIERLRETLNELPVELFRNNIQPTWFPFKSKWFRRITLSFAWVLSASILIFVFQTYLLLPDFSGNWYFEHGDYLLVIQDGNHVEIEHIDPGMQTIYEKGKGVIKGRRMEFDLDPLYTQQFRYRGSLELSSNHENLSGSFQEVLSNEEIPVALTRKIKQKINNVEKDK